MSKKNGCWSCKLLLGKIIEYNISEIAKQKLMRAAKPSHCFQLRYEIVDAAIVQCVPLILLTLFTIPLLQVLVE